MPESQTTESQTTESQTTAGALWITEAEVVAAVDLMAAIASVRAVLAMQHEATASPLDKTATGWGDGHTLHALGGAAPGLGLVGTKTWAHTGRGATPLLVLWDQSSGRLEAVVEAFALGQLRTASITAVATDVLAAAGASRLAMIGSGRQALAQVAAVVSQRPIREVRVHSPTAAHRAGFCRELAELVPGVEVVDCGSVAEAVVDAEVVVTATRARQPFLEVGMLAMEAHVNAMGAITPERRELADSVITAAALVVSDCPSIATSLSSELSAAAEVVALAEVVGGWRREATGPTVFKAMGLGLADIAVGAAVLQAMRRTGGGRPITQPRRAQPRLFAAPNAARNEHGSS
ncbi:MAG: ornithine cyclodeaminase family protein [Ilumatobacteraceae bacterium]